MADFGIYDEITMFRWDFYVPFTNLSKYLYVGIMTAAPVRTAGKRRQLR